MEKHAQQPDGSAFRPGQMQLRPYQHDVINQCRQKLAAGVSKICLVAPTGSGKTVIAAEIIRSAVAKGKRVLILTHRREILKQRRTTMDYRRNEPEDRKATFAFSDNYAVRMAPGRLCSCGREMQATDVEVLDHGRMRVVCAGCHRDFLTVER
jgi:type I site-specific restriction endonuclease